MNKEQEIEEMAKAINELLEYANCFQDEGHWIATALVEAGYRKADELIAENEKLKTSLEEAIRSFTRMETLYKVKCQELENKENKMSDIQELENKENKMSDIQELCEENISCLQELLSNESRILRLLNAAIYGEDKVRKETAKEVIDAIVEYYEKNGILNDDFIDYLRKEYGVEIKNSNEQAEKKGWDYILEKARKLLWEAENDRT